MKKNNSFIKVDKNIVLLIIAFLLTTYSYGFETALYSSISFYSIFIFIFNTRAVYILIKTYIRSKEININKTKILTLSITTLLAVIGFFFLMKKIQIFIISFSLIILLALFIADLVKKYIVKT